MPRFNTFFAMRRDPEEAESFFAEVRSRYPQYFTDENNPFRVNWPALSGDLRSSDRSKKAKAFETWRSLMSGPYQLQPQADLALGTWLQNIIQQANVPVFGYGFQERSGGLAALVKLVLDSELGLESDSWDDLQHPSNHYNPFNQGPYFLLRHAGVYDAFANLTLADVSYIVVPFFKQKLWLTECLNSFSLDLGTPVRMRADLFLSKLLTYEEYQQTLQQPQAVATRQTLPGGNPARLFAELTANGQSDNGENAEGNGLRPLL